MSVYDNMVMIFEIASFDYVSESEKKLNGPLIIQEGGVERHRLKNVTMTYHFE